MAEILPASFKNHQKALALLKAGQAVALPTETVYGLAALACDEKAVKQIFKIKNRPKRLALSICVFNQKQAEDICHISPLAKQLMQEFWPGPLTLVLPKKDNAHVSNMANANLPNIGIRCPDIHWRNAFEKLGFAQPLVLTSANTSARPNPLTAQDVNRDIGEKIPLILDGGASKKRARLNHNFHRRRESKATPSRRINPRKFCPLIYRVASMTNFAKTISELKASLSAENMG